MKQPWWERRREYLANKGKSPAPVISIADGHIKLLAESIRGQKGGLNRGTPAKEGSGAASACAAPDAIGFPAEGGAA
jgi:hypothetical protein